MNNMASKPDLEMQTISVLPTVMESKANDNFPKPCIPTRFYIAFITALTTFVMYAIRNCLSVAIVSMTVDETKLNKSTSYSMTDSNNSITIKPLHEKFAWTESQEGVILGSYFYGYAAFQIITGVISDKFNVVHLCIICNIISAILSALTPIAAHAGVAWISIVRVLIGASQAPTIALLLVLAGKWFPPDEVVLPISLLNVGGNIGSAAAMPYTAWLCNQDLLGGWPLVFYSLGAINLIIPFLWLTTITETPNNHPFISKYEIDYIDKANSNVGKVKIPVPWLSIFTSLPIWSIIVAKGCIYMGIMIFNTKIPAYLESELGMDLTSNGSFNSLLNIAMAISNLLSPPIFKYLINNGYVSRTVARKIAESISFFIPAIALVTIPFIKQNTTLILYLLVISIFFMGFQAAGDWPITSEVAPDLAGSVFGITNTTAAISGFMSPLIVGELLESGLDHSEAWRYVFFIGAGVMTFGGLVFLIFAKAEPVPWGVAPSRSIDALDKNLEAKKRTRPH
ncbi:sialin-like [Tetranychus urticae]|uniref:sialin-like n=1 Tax=Tetranychus urticae TaxID=32264 RepID=UPI00077BD7B3|nr:sialin-like [Tetranychus urticae]